MKRDSRSAGRRRVFEPGVGREAGAGSRPLPAALLRDGDLPLIPEIVALKVLAKFVNEVAQPVADVSAVQPSKVTESWMLHPRGHERINGEMV